MFDQLPESRRTTRRTVGGPLLSIAIHAVLITGAVAATHGAAQVVQGILQDTTAFLLDPLPPPPPPPTPDVPTAASTLPPPPQGFQVLTPPRELPTDIPPVDLHQRFDPRDFSGRGPEGGVFTGVPGGTGPVTDSIVHSRAFTQDEVDDPARWAGGPQPAYPEVMRAVGIDGVVRLRFVVGVDGRAESGSAEVVSSTNKAFEPPALAALRGFTFKAATRAGQPVRQLVEQQIRFTLQR